MTPQTSRLARLRVEELFGQYSHDIPLNIDQRITAIIGPNGQGKTACLHLINALMKRDYALFFSIPFKKITFNFTEGEEISVEQVPVKGSTPESPVYDLKFSFSHSGGKPQAWEPIDLEAFSTQFARINRFLPFLLRIGPSQWVDERTGDRLSVWDILDRHADALPPEFLAGIRKNEPEGFNKLLSGFECHLIETQRLLANGDGGISYIPPFEEQRRRQPSSKLAVQQKAEKLKSILQTALTDYANISQTKDRTFPQRLIEEAKPQPTNGDLPKRMTDLEARRRALMNSGILEPEESLPVLPEKKLDTGIARVLDIYVCDTNEKLDVLNPLLARVEAFREIINSRFRDKHVAVDRSHGFRVLTKTGQPIPLEKLSSGEQHHLVITFDLLFDVRRDALILIDEPELSLHIHWQKSFIDGLQKMSALNGFDALIATHAAPVVARHMDLTVELGDVDA